MVRHKSGGTVAVLAWTLSSFVFGIYRLYNVIRELSIRSERFTTLEFEGHRCARHAAGVLPGLRMARDLDGGISLHLRLLQRRV